jgi:hypothetical protein
LEKEKLALVDAGTNTMNSYVVTMKTEIIESNPISKKPRQQKITVQKAAGTAVNPLDNIQYLQSSGNIASRKAIENSKALGLPITYAEGNDIIEETADGNKKIIGHIE